MSAIETNTLVVPIQPAPEGSGELVNADTSRDPIPGLLERLRRQLDASQLLLHSPEQKIVRWSQIRRVGWVLQDLDVVGGNPSLHYGSGMNRGIIPAEKPLPGHHFRPFLPEFLQEDAQNLHDVDGVDLGTLRNDVRVDEPATVKERHDHLLCSARLHSCLDGAWFALLYPLFGLFFLSRPCGRTPLFRPS